MIFDPKKISLIIAKGGGFQSPGSEKKGDMDDDYNHGMEGLELSMSKFIEAVKNDDARKASGALQDWCKINKSYGDFTKPEESEKYEG